VRLVVGGGPRQGTQCGCSHCRQSDSPLTKCSPPHYTHHHTHTHARRATLAGELESLVGYSAFWALFTLVVLSGSLADAGARNQGGACAHCSVCLSQCVH
jgi:hypothetical protein